MVERTTNERTGISVGSAENPGVGAHPGDRPGDPEQLYPGIQSGHGDDPALHPSPASAGSPGGGKFWRGSGGRSFGGRNFGPTESERDETERPGPSFGGLWPATVSGTSRRT